jgi:DNA-binding transcriptional MocR family regulator
MQFSKRLDNVETSAIRELFKLLGKPGIISFAGGFPDSAMFDIEGIKEASQRALTEAPGPSLQYGATEGYNPLREELVQFMASKGVTGLDLNQLIVTTGSQQALDLVGKTLLEPGDTVLVEAPTFLATIQCFRLYGPKVLGVPIDSHGILVDVLEEMIVKHKPKIVYLVPSFGNPSGALTSIERRIKILELAVKYKTVFIEDDPYSDLYFTAEPPPLSLLALSEKVAGSRDWIIYCGSLSKVLSPGLRVGWLVGQPDFLSRATMCKQFSDAHTSTFAQATAAFYLKSGRMAATLANVRSVYAKRAHVMEEAMSREMGRSISFDTPLGGLFFWAKLTGLQKDGMPSKQPVIDGNAFAKKAIEQNVAFVPGAPFYADNPDHSSLRLSFATADEAKIQDGMKRLGLALVSN